MINHMQLSSILNSIVPISRFNKGEANKIFDEVKISGCKVVMKNNVPACVLITPERYEEMTEQLEDYALFMEAEMRVKSMASSTLTEDEILKDFGITEQELSNCEVNIDE